MLYPKYYRNLLSILDLLLPPVCFPYCGQINWSGTEVYSCHPPVLKCFGDFPWLQGPSLQYLARRTQLWLSLLFWVIMTLTLFMYQVPFSSGPSLSSPSAGWSIPSLPHLFTLTSPNPCLSGSSFLHSLHFTFRPPVTIAINHSLCY